MPRKVNSDSDTAREIKEAVYHPRPSQRKSSKTSSWIEHVKAYASKHGVTYRQAMKDAKASYKK